jgi:hypothetical protein
MPVIRITVQAKNIPKILERLQNPFPYLSKLGKIGVELSQDSFRDQRLGEHMWARRYPKSPSPSVNLAGIVQDLNEGKTPGNNRFQDRPALVDSHLLEKSTRWKLSGNDGVMVENSLDYAEANQDGLVTGQPVTRQAKEALKNILRRARGRIKRKFLKGQPALRAYKDSVLARLGFLFQKDWLETEHNERPFIGWTPKYGIRAAYAFESWIKGRLR